jgi:hypothetical protein
LHVYNQYNTQISIIKEEEKEKKKDAMFCFFLSIEKTMIQQTSSDNE